MQFGGYFGGGTIGDVLNQWGQAGFFSYILPFLLIFAIIFGILSNTSIFGGNKQINGIISLSVALLALQFDIVPQFFSEIFPRLGVGLAIILVALILVGMFIPRSGLKMLFILGIIIFVVVMIETAGAIGWGSAFWWKDNWPHIILAIVVIALVIGVLNSTETDEQKRKRLVKQTAEDSSVLSRLMFGN